MSQTLKQENLELKKEIQQLKKTVWLDFLTKVYNRQAFHKFLKEACEEVGWLKKHRKRRKSSAEFCLLLIDLDNFKKLNDRYSHSYGDKILRKTARFLSEKIRQVDVVARWGGDEFIILLRNVTLQQAQRKARIILKQAEEKLSITLSIGLIKSNPNSTAEKMFKQVDKALKSAKRQGKNRTIIL